VTRFQLLETLTELRIFYCFHCLLTWNFPVFCIFPFGCSHWFELPDRYVWTCKSTTTVDKV